MTDRDVDEERVPKLAVIVAEPRVMAETNPFDPETLLMVATPVFCEVHVTEAVKSCVEPSENVPVAVSCNVVPGPMTGFEGATAIDERVLTIRTVEPVTPRVAPMVVEPAATAVASPCKPEALLMVAVPMFDELHATNLVKSWTEPSAKAPVAVNCRFEPATALGLAGVMAMDTGPFTVTMVVPETPARLAMMVAEPRAVAEANPFDPETLLMVATPVFSEDHLTEAVISCVEPSENVPVAVSCNVEPGTMIGFTGATAIDERVFTVRTVEPVTPRVAPMVEEPAATAVASPCEVMVAMPLFEELQAANAVKS